MLNINFDIAFENIVDYIREREMKNSPKEVSIWIKDTWSIDSTNSGEVRINFPLIYHLKGETKETYCFCPSFTVKVYYDGTPKPVNKGAVIGAVYTKTLAQLLTHKDTKIRDFVKEILAKDPVYTQDFNPKKYFISKKDLKNELSKLYPTIKIDKSYDTITLDDGIYEINLHVNIRKVQKDKIHEVIKDLLPLRTRTEKFKNKKTRIELSSSIDPVSNETRKVDYNFNYAESSFMYYTRTYRAKSPEYVEKVLQYLEEIEELLENQLQETAVNIELDSLVKQKNIEIDLREKYRGYSYWGAKNYKYEVSDYSQLKEIIKKGVKEKIFTESVDVISDWFKDQKGVI